jgi:hypothetical protein
MCEADGQGLAQGSIAPALANGGCEAAQVFGIVR